MPHTRRTFIQSSSLAAASIASASLVGSTKAFAKNDVINVGVIGCGGRVSFQLLPKLLRIPGIKVTAVCDVVAPFLDRVKKIVGEVDKESADLFATKAYEELLARKNVDAVLIGTPDHWHVPCTIAACEAGKDVYVEKPLTHKLSEGAKVVAAQNDHKRIVQVGTQQRSMPHFQKARELIQQGALGTVHKIHMTWNRNSQPFRKYVPDIKEADVDWKRFLGNAKEQPFDAYRLVGNWRWFWDFGGGILTDLMVHWLDSVNYLLDLPMPSSAVTMGDNIGAKGVWETPDTIQTILHYPDRQLQIHFEGTFVNAYTKAHLVLMGTAASMYLDRGHCEILPEPRSKTQAATFGEGKSERGADFDSNVDGEGLHLTNWIEAVRARKKPIAPAEAGALAAAGAHLGNQAYLQGKKVEWDGK